MREKYRDRSGRIVTLSYEQLAEIDRTDSVIVEIGGVPIELHTDQRDITRSDGATKTLILSPEAIDRLASGFPLRFFSVLPTTEADGDLVLMAEDRPVQEERMIDRADGLVDYGVAEYENGSLSLTDGDGTILWEYR